MLFTAEETNKTMLDVLRGLFTVGGFNHKMPKEGKMTKTLETCIERINSFMNGTFEKDWNLDLDWYNDMKKRSPEIADKLKQQKTLDETVRLLLKSCNHLKEARENKALFPLRKETLPDSFVDFMCAYTTGKSWMLYFLYRGNETMRETEAADYVANIPKSFKAVVSELGLDYLWTPYLSSMAEGIVKLNDWRKSMKESSNSPWLFEAHDFWEAYIEYITDVIGSGCIPSKGHFMPDGRLHKSFCKNIGV